MTITWAGRPVLVTGGASFIGSHLVEALLGRGASVRVADDLSSGTLDNLRVNLDAGRIDFREGDLRDQGFAAECARGIGTVFHLAADHGGRGYVDLNQSACATNLVLDGVVFNASVAAGVEQVIYASSGCVYPNFRQMDPAEEVFLSEESAGPPYDADNLYGWAKLMGEMTLAALCREGKLKGASCRYFTVYGERGRENHAVIAMIARAFIGQDPFLVWGTGEQVRNWTYVGDVVEGTIRAAEAIEDGSPVNIGTMERIRVIDAVRDVLRYTGRSPRIEFQPAMPTGPLNRVADNSLSERLLGWRPGVRFEEGLQRTIDWYFATKDRDEVSRSLDSWLTTR
ncbi:MAG: NAD-dependent epimerase/dehydratase family protein [Dehalococcoidia bacterium]